MDKQEKEYLEMGSHYIRKLLTDILNVKFRLRNGDTKSYLHVVDLIDGINMLINLLIKLKRKERHEIDLDLEKVKGLFDEIESGLQNNDANLIADVLEYEINPLLVAWDHNLKTAREHI